jgi:alkylation response protein AidB-like acyl-CoA dehydrogenase
MTQRSASSYVLGGAFLLEAADCGTVFTPEDFTSEDRAMAQAARDFVDKEVIPRVAELEEKKPGMMDGLARKAGELGFLGVLVPEQYGGLGTSKALACLIEEQLGRAGSFAVTCSAHTGIGTMPIIYFGSEETKAKYLPKLATGEWLGAYCLSEAESGSDALSMRTKAALSDDGGSYVLNGSKMWITNAGLAQVYIVLAKMNGDKYGAFVVERSFPGLSIEKEEHKLGICGSSTCRITLDDCRVPRANLLGEPGKGHLIAFNILNMGRYKLGAGALGGAKQILRLSATYATERKQFGKPIGQFGLIQQKLAQMARRIFATESILYRTAGMMDVLEELGEQSRSVAPGFPLYVEEYAIECSTIKVVASENLGVIADEGVQIHGGYGYSEEFPLARAYRDARINRIFEGTSEINRLFIPAMLLRRAERGKLPLMAAIARVQKELIGLAPSGTSSPASPIERAEEAAANVRRLCLLLAGVAYQRFGNNLLEEQEVLAGLADVVMELYKLDSVALRARKTTFHGKQNCAQLQQDLLELQREDTLQIAQVAAHSILPHVASGDELRSYLGVARRLLKREPIDLVAVARRVAQAVYDAKAYPL